MSLRTTSAFDILNNRNDYGRINVQTNLTVDFRPLLKVTFQSPVAKFVLNIPNYITKFGILRGNLQVVELSTEVPN